MEQHNHSVARPGWRRHVFSLIVLVLLGLLGFMVVAHVQHNPFRGLPAGASPWLKVIGFIPLVVGLHPLLALLHPVLALLVSLGAASVGVRTRRNTTRNRPR